MSEIRKKRQWAVHRLHDQFVADNLDAPFRPESRPGSPDYNMHYIDLEAGQAEYDFSVRALQIERGELDDQLDEIIGAVDRRG